MPWVNPIDPALPADTDQAAQGDDQIRQLKAAIEERMQQFMPGWPATQPLRLKAALVDLLANRPAAPAGDGEVFIASDTDDLYFGEAGAWTLLTIPVDPSNVKVPPWPNLASIEQLGVLTVTDSSICIPPASYKIDTSWVNGNATLKTIILINGLIVHTADAAATAAAGLTHADLTAGARVLVTAMHFDDVNVQLGPPRHKIVDIADPCSAGTPADPSNLHLDATSRNTVGAGEDTLETITVPGGNLGATGGVLLHTVWNIIGTSGTKTIIVRFGGSTVYTRTTGATAAGRLSLRIYIVNTAASSQVITGEEHFEGSPADFNMAINASVIDTSLNRDIVIAANPADAADQIQLRLSHARYIGTATV